jgi:hypothetical protein
MATSEAWPGDRSWSLHDPSPDPEGIKTGHRPGGELLPNTNPAHDPARGRSRHDRRHRAVGDTRGRAAHRAPGGRGDRSHHKGDGRCPGADPAPPCGQRSEGRADRTPGPRGDRIRHLHFCPVPPLLFRDPGPNLPASRCCP